VTDNHDIRIAIAGVGNCASALVQGLTSYANADAKAHQGLMNFDINGYQPRDIRPVCAFDIDERKVGQSLEEAVFAPPNCAQIFQPDLASSGVVVQMAPPLDFASHLDLLSQLDIGTLTVAELVAGKHSSRERSVVLSFDDGFADNVEVVLPLLVERGMKATFFWCPVWPTAFAG
jgi:myo-inositol-1-phosphate synthase